MKRHHAHGHEVHGFDADAIIDHNLSVLGDRRLNVAGKRDNRRALTSPLNRAPQACWWSSRSERSRC